VWALKDINFEVMPGEILGVVGKNGAGKSTLLKILSKVTGPTTGRIDYNGRIGSLLEVGTGFHPELTGRDNIFLNGAILGMTKAEIRSKLDEIIDFSGCERYIDTPVKRYSSGMMVRLGFAVAAHLEPEILVVDEVLAVGDAEFQKKAIGKMQDVSQNDGRTVLFVSHNMAAVKNICAKGVMIANGQIMHQGKIEDTIEQYLRGDTTGEVTTALSANRSGTGRVRFAGLSVYNGQGNETETIITGEDVTLAIQIMVNEPRCRNIDIGVSLHDNYDDVLCVLYSGYQNQLYHDLPVGLNTVYCTFRNFYAAPMRLKIYGRIMENGIESDWLKDPLGAIGVEMGDFYKTGKVGHIHNTKFLLSGEWKA
jgi:lipopolysaccharide transport system ATP-binding protein